MEIKDMEKVTTETAKAKPAKAKSVTDKDMEKVTTETEKVLNAQRKVRLTIMSPDPKEVIEVGVNGKFYRFPCNKSVEVPETIAEIIEQSRSIVRDADKHGKEYGSKDGEE